MNLLRILVLSFLTLAFILTSSPVVMAQCNAKFTASSVTGKTNDEVVVKISVDNFTDIASLQWTIRWDQTVLQYVDIVDIDLPDLSKIANFNLTRVTQGFFTTTWNNQQGITKSNGSVIFGIKFKLIGADGKTSGVTFSSTPLKFEIGDKNGNECKTASFVDGKVDIGTVIQPPAGVGVKAGSGSVGKDQEICIPVTVSGFSKVTAMQFSMGWDTSKIKFSKVQKFAGFVGSWDTGSFGISAAKATVLWTDPATTGQTLTDGTAIFEICFRFTGACPGTATVNFTNDLNAFIAVPGSPPANQIPLNKEAGTITGTCGNTALSVSSTKIIHPCPGQTNGAIEITAVGGAGNFTYTWTNNATSKDVSNLGAGTYNVTVKDGNNATATLSAAIVLTSLTVTAQQTAPTTGASNGSITLTVSGGTGTPTYLWSNNATSQNINNLAANTYTYTVTDGNNCKVTGTVNLGGTSALDVINITPISPGCSGQVTGSINVTISGGKAPFTFAWTGPNGYTSTSEDITGLQGGTYKLTVKDADNATKTTSDVVLANALTLTPRLKQPTGNSNDGEITITPTGGTPAISYRWNDGSTSGARTSLLKGTYAVTATDSRGCTATGSYNLSGIDGSCFTSIRAFTPNGDGINELFIINCADNGSNQVQIYNRWNQLVFSANNYRNNWNGIDNKGLLLPDGTYYWILKETTTNALYKGHVALIRTLN